MDKSVCFAGLGGCALVAFAAGAADINFRNFTEGQKGDLACADNYYWPETVTKGDFGDVTVWADQNASSAQAYLSSDLTIGKSFLYGQGNGGEWVFDLNKMSVGESRVLAVSGDFRIISQGNSVKILSGTVRAGKISLSDQPDTKIIVSGETARLEMTDNTSWLGISQSGAEIRAENGGIFDMDAAGKANNEYVIQNEGSLVAGTDGVVTNANRLNIWGGSNGRVVVDGGRMYASNGFKDGSYSGTGSSVEVKNGGLLDLGTGGLVWKGWALANTTVSVHGKDSRIVAKAVGLAISESACSNLFLIADGAEVDATRENGQITWGNGNNAGKPCARNYFVVDDATLNLSGSNFRLSDNWGSNNFFIARNNAKMTLNSFIFGGNCGYNHALVTSGASVTAECTTGNGLQLSTNPGDTFELSDGATFVTLHQQVRMGNYRTSFTVDNATFVCSNNFVVTNAEGSRITVRNGGLLQVAGWGIGSQGSCPEGKTPCEVTLDGGELLVTGRDFYFGNYGTAMKEPVLNLKGRSRIHALAGSDCYMNFSGDMIVNWFLPKDGYELPEGEGVIHNPGKEVDFGGVKELNFDADSLLAYAHNGGGTILLASGSRVMLSDEQFKAWNAAVAAVHPRMKLDHTYNERLCLKVPNLGGTIVIIR